MTSKSTRAQIDGIEPITAVPLHISSSVVPDVGYRVVLHHVKSVPAADECSPPLL